MGKDFDTLAGILIGILGLAFLAKLTEKKCPICNNIIPAGKTQCPHCGHVV